MNAFMNSADEQVNGNGDIAGKTNGIMVNGTNNNSDDSSTTDSGAAMEEDNNSGTATTANSSQHENDLQVSKMNYGNLVFCDWILG